MDITQAVILAAGKGQRLNHIGNNIPKGFLKLGEKAIIEESIEKLLSVGMKNIIIVTGYQDAFYENLKGEFNEITTVKNEKYAESGTMYSLYCARNLIDRDFLLLESDLIYETRGLMEIINFPKRNCLLLSGKTLGGDEVYVKESGGLVSAISKDLTCLKNVVGEFVGISKISIPIFKKMIHICGALFKWTLQVDYDMDCIDAIAKENPIFYKKIEDLLWAEIDDEFQFLRALKIREQILAKSQNP